MHGTYMFLIDLDPGETGKDAVEHALGAFDSYASTFCDENNWYGTMALVMQDGTTIGLAEKDEFVKPIRKVKKDRRWRWALKFAMSCVLIDLYESLVWVTQDYEKKYKLSMRNAEEIGRQALADFAKTASPWALKNLASRIGQIKDISDEWPFGNLDDPYSGPRAQDLRTDDEQKDNLAILFVDIHT